MATYSVDANDNGVGAWTMTASTVDTVTFAGNVQRVRVINEGPGTVFVTLDGSEPTVPEPGVSTRTIRVPASSILETTSSDADVVKLVSDGTPLVGVEQAL